MKWDTLSPLLFLLRADRERLSAAVADEGGYSTIRSVGKKTHRVGAIGSLASLPCLRCAGSGHQLPVTYKFIVGMPESTSFSHRLELQFA
jgi:hypothetical protein